MADLALLAEFLKSCLASFLGTEYRDLYAVGTLVLGQVSLWVGKNISWSPKYLMKNTRQAWARLGEADGDNVIRVMCCTAPAIADVLLVLVHAAAGLSRKPEAKAVARKYHDRLLTKTEELRDELESIRIQLSESVASDRDDMLSLKETVYTDHAVEHALTKERLGQTEAKLKELENAYVDSTEETVRSAVQKILGTPAACSTMAMQATEKEDRDVRELYHRVLQRDKDRTETFSKR